MPIIIDGHNLIPHIPGIQLNDLDDEHELVEMLQEYCQRTTKRVEVYFDKAAPGGQRAKVFGRVTARFVHAGMTADTAIANHLKRLGKEARNWSVVSSDNEVNAAARRAQAQTISSAAFAQQIFAALHADDKGAAPDLAAPLSAADVDEWMDLFSQADPGKD
ncbi:MAG: NYN domain-containing protein [Anaerolineae bacterium]|nr:NYN domain-containing protein [Anaerolineae bacterium]